MAVAAEITSRKVDHDASQLHHVAAQSAALRVSGGQRTQPIDYIEGSVKMSSTGLKCPHCWAVRPTENRLQTHMDLLHKNELVPESLDMSQRLADTGKRLDKAGVEIRGLQAQADAVIQRLAALDAHLIRPEVVRRTTLNQVLNKLMDEGSLDAARIVYGMLDDLPETSTH